jgi:hypothetical protein
MRTLSGRRFEIGTKYAPTIRDIAIGLSRIPRWAGATVRPWSVLQHSLAVGSLLSAENPVVHLAALVHDMEEVATGDIPSPFKTKTQRELGVRMRAWLYSEVLVQPLPDDATEQLVHVVDDQLKLAELLCLCHPRAMWDPYFRDSVLGFVGAENGEDFEIMGACDAVWDLIDMPEREAIETFTELVADLLNTKALRAMERRA